MDPPRGPEVGVMVGAPCPIRMEGPRDGNPVNIARLLRLLFRWLRERKRERERERERKRERDREREREREIYIYIFTYVYIHIYMYCKYIEREREREREGERKREIQPYIHVYIYIHTCIYTCHIYLDRLTLNEHAFSKAAATCSPAQVLMPARDVQPQLALLWLEH